MTVKPVKKALLAAFLGFGIFLSAHGQETEKKDPWESWMTGTEAVSQGNKASAVHSFREAAAAWSGEGTASGHYNAGTAWILAENPALAVVSFHRALAADPFNGDAVFNLTKLRGEKGLESPPWDPSWKSILTVLLSGISAVVTGLALVILGKRLRNPGRAPLFLLAAGLLSGALGLALPLRADVRVVAGEAAPRRGDGLYYEPVEGGSWKPGQEVLVIQSRSGWVRVKTQVREGWLQETYLLQP